MIKDRQLVLVVLSVVTVITSLLAWGEITRTDVGVQVTENQALAQSVLTDLNDVEPYTAEDLQTEVDLEQALQDKRERDAINVALEDSKVKGYTKGEKGVDAYWKPVKKQGKVYDEVTFRWVEKRTVTGDWQTSQTRLYTGIYDVKVLVRNGKVTSVDATPLSDKTVTQTFTEVEKGIISIAMQNANVQELLKGRKVFVNGIHVGTALFDPALNCPVENCVIVGFLKENSAKDALAVWVNPSAGHVAKIAPSDGW